MRDMIDVLVRNCAARGLVPPDTSAHTLRHNFAMNYLKANPGDLFGLATLLGHTSLDTTRIYGQPTAEQLATRVDRLNLNAYAE
jgi:site-specific recombinase XerD